jgi:hypothetical protein
MRDLFILLGDLLTAVAKILGPGGARAVVAESLLMLSRAVRSAHGDVIGNSPCTRYGCNREAILGEVCLRAGLPGHAWKAPSGRLYAFEILKWGEAE